MTEKNFKNFQNNTPHLTISTMSTLLEVSIIEPILILLISSNLLFVYGLLISLLQEGVEKLNSQGCDISQLEKHIYLVQSIFHH